MSKNNSQEMHEVKRRSKKRFCNFKKKIEGGLTLPNLEVSEKASIQALCGYEGGCEHMLASNMPLRWDAARALKSALFKHRKERPKGRRQYYFGTFIDDCGNTSDRSPLVRLREIKDKAYRALKALGLHAVAVIEVHPLMNYPAGGEGRMLLFHVHFIAWSDESFDPSLASAQLNASSAWKNSLGADPVQIKEIGASRDQLATVAYYLLKPPHSAKNRMPSKKDQARFLLMDTIEGYRPELALRLVEGLSQLDLRDTIFGVNAGGKIRQEVRSRIQKKHQEKLKSGVLLDSAFDIWLFWLNLRRKFGSENYLPFRFQGPSIGPSATRLRPPKLPKPRKRRPGSNQRRLSRRRPQKRSRLRL